MAASTFFSSRTPRSSTGRSPSRRARVASLSTISPSPARSASRAPRLVGPPGGGGGAGARAPRGGGGQPRLWVGGHAGGGVGPAPARAALDLGGAEERGSGVDAHVHRQ